MNTKNIYNDSEQKIYEKLKEYENFTREIDEEINLLKRENTNENIELLEEIIEESLGIYTVNESIKDKQGGAVQTVNNMKKDIYADEKYRYNSSKLKEGGTKREEYEGIYGEQQKRKFKAKTKDKNNGIDICEYSNTETENPHVDHIASISEVHRNGGFMLNEQEKKNFLNREENFAIIDGSINQSKGDDSYTTFNSKVIKNKNPNQLKNEERFSKDEKSYSENIKKKDENIRKEMLEIERKKGLEFYSKNSLIEGAKKGGNMAIKTAVSEIMMIGNREFLIHIKNNINKNSNILDFLKNLLEGLFKGLKKILTDIKNIIVKIAKSLSNGLIETIITTVINIFSTTATAIIKSIRLLVNIILNAKKSFNNLRSTELRTRKKEILSLILNGILLLPIFNGLGITDAIEKAIQSIGIPNIISDVLALGLTTMLGSGLVFIGARVFEKIQKMINEGNIRKLEIMNGNMKMQMAAGEAFMTQIEMQELAEFTKNYTIKMNMDWKSESLENEILLSDYNAIIKEFSEIDIIMEEETINNFEIDKNKNRDIKKEMRSKLNKIRNNI